ncbi:CAP domain-containing protein [Micromonospora haikouensis]|uniref:CAP domain-containing protein n=1 Tax=Micromonospora haikouensis TaxID=686309 RepID=UPI000B8A35CA|nr:CAP domain-containing protein [Micromonospora haikouensis]
MEATGVYGWTDPNDPEGARWRQEPPADEPAWLTDRPAPRSTYLFGDEPDQPSDQRHTDQPPAPPADRPWAGEPTARWHSPEQPNGQWHAPERASDQWYPADQPAPAAEHTRALPIVEGPVVAGPTVGSATPAAGQPADLAARRADTAAGSGEGRHRPARRLPRPLLIGGAAAAATLVVSLGVGALVLPGGDAPRTDPAAADAPVAAPADPADPTSAGPSPSPSPSASPTSASPSPSPSRTAKPTPKPSRTTAASRSNQRSSAPATPRVAAAPGVSAQAQEVVNLVNAERAKAGCGALKIDDKLMAAAQAHSQDQADHRKMTHDGSDGSDVGERLDRAGYAWRAYGENVAWNQQTPAAVMDAWMNSPGHRANILNCSFTEIGVGVANSNGPYWTQDFGTPR